MTEAVWQAAKKLAAAAAASSDALHDKFVQDGAFIMEYGGLDTFFGGLEGLIGEPSPNLMGAITHEHCNSIDSDLDFHAGNYGTTTTSKIEYDGRAIRRAIRRKYSDARPPPQVPLRRQA